MWGSGHVETKKEAAGELEPELGGLSVPSTGTRFHVCSKAVQKYFVQRYLSCKQMEEISRSTNQKQIYCVVYSYDETLHSSYSK